MLTSAIPLQDVDPALLPLPGLISDTDAPDCDEAVPWRAVPVSRALAWGDEAALLLRERARLGPVFRRGERVILLDPAFNRLVLDDDGALFPRAEPGGALALDTAVLERVLAAELARWREGTIRFQPAMAMALARALVPAVTGLAPGSGAAERLANALSTLDEGRSLLRRAMPRGLPSSPIGARQALAQGLRAAGADAPGLVDSLQASHALALRALGTLVRHLADTPDWQDTLRAEVRSPHRLSTPAGVETATQDGLRELVDMATCEALRLMPAPVLVERRLLAPLAIGAHRLEAGTRVAISPAATHADPALWPDPQHFDPLRFARLRTAERAPGAWIAADVLPAPVAPVVIAATRLGVAHLLARFGLATAGEGGKLLLRRAD
ncbi:cytochrome P450 [Novosphingobium pokkalii]|uniref:Cytochrome P450 n=1 Tax=Novosphingobium pokkalii TaxID=1770194 RepID=A0ABV7VA57_9SPHN|nr:cytochrome P450 [Novosphingobium pokkalii]GHC97800.1 hypothetical protein GCM10019060_28940 [Novosphingobium pokkalii]